MLFSSIIAVSTLPGLYYFLTFQVQNTFFSCTVKVIAKTKANVSWWGRMLPNGSQFCNFTVSVLQSHSNSVLQILQMSLLLFPFIHIVIPSESITNRCVWSVLCTDYKQRTKKSDCKYLNASSKASVNRRIKMSKTFWLGHSEWTLH